MPPERHYKRRARGEPELPYWTHHDIGRATECAFWTSHNVLFKYDLDEDGYELDSLDYGPCEYETRRGTVCEYELEPGVTLPNLFSDGYNPSALHRATRWACARLARSRSSDRCRSGPARRRLAASASRPSVARTGITCRSSRPVANGRVLGRFSRSYGCWYRAVRTGIWHASSVCNLDRLGCTHCPLTS
jgi:hypothetical protein